MIKVLGKGLTFLKSIATEENLKIAEKFISKVEKVGEDILGKMSEVNNAVVENTDNLCDVLETDFLDKDSLKEVIENYGSKNFQFVALLKGRYDDKRDRRVFFIQKLDSEKQPVKEYEILCLYVNNVDTNIQQWFGDKEMVLINK